MQRTAGLSDPQPTATFTSTQHNTDGQSELPILPACRLLPPCSHCTQQQLHKLVACWRPDRNTLVIEGHRRSYRSQGQHVVIQAAQALPDRSKKSQGLALIHLHAALDVHLAQLAGRQRQRQQQQQWHSQYHIRTCKGKSVA